MTINMMPLEQTSRSALHYQLAIDVAREAIDLHGELWEELNSAMNVLWDCDMEQDTATSGLWELSALLHQANACLKVASECLSNYQ